MTLVEVMVLSGAMPSSVTITLDVLATANRLRVKKGLQPAFATHLSGSGARAVAPLAKSGGLRLVDGRGQADVVIVPGLGLSTEHEVNTRLARRDAFVAQRRLAAAVERGARVATSCSGTFLLAAAELLDGKRATTSWWLAPLFRRMHPGVELDTDALVVTDGPITTAGAAMAQLDLMLGIVTRYARPSIAEECARYLLLDARRSQSRYMALAYLAASDENVARADRWARKRLEDGFSMNELAAAAGLSARTFARRLERSTGLSPVRFVQRLRVERAIDLLQTTRLPFEEIARRVGYAEPTTLRRIIRREAGLSPRELRIVDRTPPG